MSPATTHGHVGPAANTCLKAKQNKTRPKCTPLCAFWMMGGVLKLRGSDVGRGKRRFFAVVDHLGYIFLFFKREGAQGCLFQLHLSPPVRRTLEVWEIRPRLHGHM